MPKKDKKAITKLILFLHLFTPYSVLCGFSSTNQLKNAANHYSQPFGPPPEAVMFTLQDGSNVMFNMPLNALRLEKTDEKSLDFGAITRMVTNYLNLKKPNAVYSETKSSVHMVPLKQLPSQSLPVHKVMLPPTLLNVMPSVNRYAQAAANPALNILDVVSQSPILRIIEQQQTVRIPLPPEGHNIFIPPPQIAFQAPNYYKHPKQNVLQKQKLYSLPISPNGIQIQGQQQVAKTKNEILSGQNKYNIKPLFNDYGISAQQSYDRPQQANNKPNQPYSQEKSRVKNLPVKNEEYHNTQKSPTSYQFQVAHQSRGASSVRKDQKFLPSDSQYKDSYQKQDTKYEDEQEKQNDFSEYSPEIDARRQKMNSFLHNLASKAPFLQHSVQNTEYSEQKQPNYQPIQSQHKEPDIQSYQQETVGTKSPPSVTVVYKHRPQPYGKTNVGKTRSYGEPKTKLSPSEVGKKYNQRPESAITDQKIEQQKPADYPTQQKSTNEYNIGSTKYESGFLPTNYYRNPINIYEVPAPNLEQKTNSGNYQQIKETYPKPSYKPSTVKVVRYDHRGPTKGKDPQQKTYQEDKIPKDSYDTTGIKTNYGEKKPKSVYGYEQPKGGYNDQGSKSVSRSYEPKATKDETGFEDESIKTRKITDARQPFPSYFKLGTKEVKNSPEKSSYGKKGGYQPNSSKDIGFEDESAKTSKAVEARRPFSSYFKLGAKEVKDVPSKYDDDKKGGFESKGGQIDERRPSSSSSVKIPKAPPRPLPPIKGNQRPIPKVTKAPSGTVADSKAAAHAGVVTKMYEYRPKPDEGVKGQPKAELIPNVLKTTTLVYDSLATIPRAAEGVKGGDPCYNKREEAQKGQGSFVKKVQQEIAKGDRKGGYEDESNVGERKHISQENVKSPVSTLQDLSNKDVNKDDEPVLRTVPPIISVPLSPSNRGRLPNSDSSSGNEQSFDEHSPSDAKSDKELPKVLHSFGGFGTRQGSQPSSGQGIPEESPVPKPINDSDDDSLSTFGTRIRTPMDQRPKGVTVDDKVIESMPLPPTTDVDKPETTNDKDFDEENDFDNGPDDPPENSEDEDEDSNRGFESKIDTTYEHTTETDSFDDVYSNDDQK